MRAHAFYQDMRDVRVSECAREGQSETVSVCLWMPRGCFGLVLNDNNILSISVYSSTYLHGILHLIHARALVRCEGSPKMLRH